VEDATRAAVDEARDARRARDRGVEALAQAAGALLGSPVVVVVVVVVVARVVARVVVVVVRGSHLREEGSVVCRHVEDGGGSEYGGGVARCERVSGRSSSI